MASALILNPLGMLVWLHMGPQAGHRLYSALVSLVLHKRRLSLTEAMANFESNEARVDRMEFHLSSSLLKLVLMGLLGYAGQVVKHTCVHAGTFMKASMSAYLKAWVHAHRFS